LKLNQLLAVERGIKQKREDEFTKIHQRLQKQELVNGFTKTYQPNDEGGERKPAESKNVQVKATEEVEQLRKGLAELFDVVAMKDRTNCDALADVVVDGAVLVKGVPATHLLFIEKKLTDLITFIKKLPTLSTDEQWNWNEALGLYATEPIETVTTKKVVEHVVVVQPTKEHPAQVKEVSRDVPVGRWKAVKYSSALRESDVRDILERAEKLQKAVKFAREEANQTKVTELSTGRAVLDFIFLK